MAAKRQFHDPRAKLQLHVDINQTIMVADPAVGAGMIEGINIAIAKAAYVKRKDLTPLYMGELPETMRSRSLRPSFAMLHPKPLVLSKDSTPLQTAQIPQPRSQRNSCDPGLRPPLRGSTQCPRHKKNPHPEPPIPWI